MIALLYGEESGMAFMYEQKDAIMIQGKIESIQCG